MRACFSSGLLQNQKQWSATEAGEVKRRGMELQVVGPFALTNSCKFALGPAFYRVDNGRT